MLLPGGTNWQVISPHFSSLAAALGVTKFMSIITLNFSTLICCLTRPIWHEATALLRTQKFCL